MTLASDYAKTRLCHHCKGEGYEPCENYEMTDLDYILGPRTCSWCHGEGTFNQMEDDERFDRMCR